MFPRAPVTDQPMPKLQMYDHIIMKYQANDQCTLNTKTKPRSLSKFQLQNQELKHDKHDLKHLTQRDHMLHMNINTLCQNSKCISRVYADIKKS